MKLALSVLTVVTLVAGGAFAADTKKPESKPAPAKAAPAAPAAPKTTAPKTTAPATTAPAASKSQDKSSGQSSQAGSQQAKQPKTPAPAPATPAPATHTGGQTGGTQSGKPTGTKPTTGTTTPPPAPTTHTGGQTGGTQSGKPTGTKPTTGTTTPPTPVTHPPKPVVHAPPAAKPVAAKPAQVQQQKQQETAAVKAKVPAAVAAKIPAGSTAKVNKNNTVTIRDAKGNTKVVDATTGKQRMSYNANTGKSVYTPPSGATTVVSGNQTVRTAPGGYKQVETRNNFGTKDIKTTVNNTTVSKTYVTKNTYVSNKTVNVTINNVRTSVVINENRNYVVRNTGFGFVPVYQPVWFGAPRSWVFGGVVVFDAFYPRVGFVSPYWGVNGGFVLFGNPYVCPFGGCWSDYSWYGDRYYSGYYVAAVSYPSIGDYMVDAYIQRQLENDRMIRLAAIEADATYEAQLASFEQANNPAINQGNQPIPSDLRETLVQQFEDEVAATQAGTQLQASDMIAANAGEGDGHVFGVNDPMTEDTTVNGNDYQCHLGHGDFLVQDSSMDVDTEPALDEDGNVVLDDSGNVVNNTFVTMLVKKSKRGDCAEGLDVVVQLDTLQNMLDEEAAQAQSSMEKAVSMKIGQ